MVRLEVRVGVGVEERDLVVLVLRQAERIEADAPLDSTVAAADVESKVAVDEDPHVIVAAKGEHLTALVLPGFRPSAGRKSLDSNLW